MTQKSHNILITQTDYIDFISRAGFPKWTAVRNLYIREEYHPSKDFYRSIRTAFINFVRTDMHKSELYTFIAKQPQKKHVRFEQLTKGWLRFLGRKEAIWVDPPIGYWQYKNLSVKMNPEIGMILNGEKYLIKLYFKDTPLNKGNVKILLRMMQSTLATESHSGYKCALLDVERGKLHYFTDELPEIDDLVKGEAESFIKMWQGLEDRSKAA